ncbi:hypothetical protein V466_17735 [Pseudomonas mandelii PD30]|uniref:Uncharacterized protein n=1 Tax=Pseudomonas mandelii PD30 TaxID=1419583 RepID=A0A059L1E9_9PSED|nr:hypothetical protein V466_17735 [Pseudomonas mandelii PD30]
MVKAPGILFVMAFYGLESGLPVKDRSLRQLLHKAPPQELPQAAIF